MFLLGECVSIKTIEKYSGVFMGDICLFLTDCKLQKSTIRPVNQY